MEADTSLTIYDGGSDQAEMIGNPYEAMNETKISTSRNQIFVDLHTKGKKACIRLNAIVIESK